MANESQFKVGDKVTLKDPEGDLLKIKEEASKSSFFYASNFVRNFINLMKSKGPFKVEAIDEDFISVAPVGSQHPHHWRADLFKLAE